MPKRLALFLTIALLCTLESVLIDFQALRLEPGRIPFYADERRLTMLIGLGAVFSLCLPRLFFIVFIGFQFVSNLFILSYIENISNPPLL
jgi:hypothetical protein